MTLILNLKLDLAMKNLRPKWPRGVLLQPSARLRTSNAAVRPRASLLMKASLPSVRRVLLPSRPSPRLPLLSVMYQLASRPIIRRRLELTIWGGVTTSLEELSRRRPRSSCTSRWSPTPRSVCAWLVTRLTPILARVSVVLGPRSLSTA
jgi:hypothetical protein